MAVAIAFAIASGCLSDKPSPDLGTTATNTSTAASTQTARPTGNATLDEPQAPTNEMLLSRCHAIEAFRNYPAVIAPGERPEGWSPDSPDNVAAVAILAYRCERIAIAGYERGPFHLLLDWHGNAAIPPECEVDSSAVTKFGILRHLVTDNPEIAAYLQSTFGVPTLLATFSQRDNDFGASALHEWSWSIDGATPSVVTLLDPKQNSPNPTMHVRLFWQVGAGLGGLDLQTDGNGPITQMPANGTIRPPLLLASDTDGHFVGDGQWLDAAHAQGAFTRYADLECNEPQA
ncbi:MAG: hypothetical protein ACYC2H_04315 [Thermoplasmatota archaeon]